jgi:MFS family permease
MMRVSELRRAPVQPRGRGQVMAGLRYVRATNELWIPLVMMAIIGAFAFNFAVTLPLFAKTSLDGSDTTFTIIYSVVSIGSLVGALYTARRQHTTLRHVEIGAAAFGLSMLAMAVAPDLGVAVVVSLALGVASILFMTAGTALAQMRAAPEMRGRVLALQAIVFLGTTPIGGPILGVVCEEFGARAGLVLGGVACLVAAAWGGMAARRTSAEAEMSAPEGHTVQTALSAGG